MKNIPKWIDIILNKYILKVKISSKMNTCVDVEFTQLPDIEYDENGKKCKVEYEAKLKNNLWYWESQKIFETIKVIFGDHLKEGCIDRLEKIDYHDVKSETLEENYEINDYQKYKEQTERAVLPELHGLSASASYKTVGNEK